ncbi:MAG: class I adenylate-forming enzyme family protein [Actinomycetota bacterium]|jgi:acyl-CoA synthetase (AMP-forming)/AMP-acid ligase II|nr:class I adenylate-forming enzyme family protein [Actinomycetota bacterium]
MTTPTMQEATDQLTAPGQTFEMEEVDIFGVPTRVWRNCPPSLRTVLELSRLHGDKVFLVYEDETTTFEQHFRQAATLANTLRDRYGVTKGDRVAIVMRNLPEWVVAFWAAAACGAVVVPVNAWWQGAELEYALADSGSVVAFVDTERLERLRPHFGQLPGLRAVVVADENRQGADGQAHLADGGAAEPTSAAGEVAVASFAEVLGTPADDVTLPDVTIDPEDDATIFYTSGTTGQPKGAVGTHRNICTNLMSLFFVNTRAGVRKSGSVADISDSQQNAYLLSVPLFHATGCHAILVANTASGGKLVMMHHWDPERALELIEREHITIFGGVPAMVMQAIDSPDFAKRDTSSIRSVAYGGAPAPPDLVRRIKEHFPGGSASNGYGLTETSSVTTMNMGDDYVRKPESVGPAVPVCDVAIVPDGFDGDEPTPELPVGPDVIGELWIKGPNVVRGYWNKPEETAQSFTKGWLHTGDIARIDEEGFIHIVDRAKDMVIRGGENVYCVEVEGVLFEHPAVSDCAVIGVPHPVLSEEVGAAVVLRAGTSVTADELSRYLRERLAGFKVPTHYWFRSEPLPRNPQGKVLKRDLRHEVLGDS